MFEALLREARLHSKTALTDEICKNNCFRVSVIPTKKQQIKRDICDAIANDNIPQLHRVLSNDYDLTTTFPTEFHLNCIGRYDAIKVLTFVLNPLNGLCNEVCRRVCASQRVVLTRFHGKCLELMLTRGKCFKPSVTYEHLSKQRSTTHICSLDRYEVFYKRLAKRG